MGDLLLSLPVGVWIAIIAAAYGLGSVVVCLLVGEKPTGMPRLARAAITGAVWWALGARRPRPRHATPSRKEQRHV